MTNPKRNLNLTDAIGQLIHGNARFISGLKSVDTIVSTTMTRDLAQSGQWPFCIILTCSDSRLPIEQIFDKGMGDLFVIRSFGNTVDPLVLASIEYALISFNIELILIMGHSRQGAIRFVMENEENNLNEISPALRTTFNKLVPSLQKARTSLNIPGTLKPKSEQWEQVYQETCRLNVLNSADEIYQGSKIIQTKINEKTLSIVPSVCEIDSGKIKFDLTHKLVGKVDLPSILSDGNYYVDKVKEVLCGKI